MPKGAPRALFRLVRKTLNMTSTAKQMRDWSGPAIFSFGFRPFFLGAMVLAGGAMALRIAMLSGAAILPSVFDPVSWHAHEFLFGYVGAVVAGFLLTAVPNWTGRLPIVGWPLAALAAVWIAGRVAVAGIGGLTAPVVAVIDLAFPVLLAAAIAREIVTGKNWKNLIVLAMLVVFTIGNGLFHADAARGNIAAQGLGLRIGLGAVLMMIAVIGGRIIPSFTRNWLVKTRPGGSLPVPPMQRFDKAALLVLLLALGGWVIRPSAEVTSVLLVVAGLLHLARLSRWAGHRTAAEPLVLVLHLAYAFLPLGAISMGVAILLPDTAIGLAAAQHLWMGGAIGLMTLAVMTRATLGHTGQALTAGPGTVAVYLLVIPATLARVAAGVWPAEAGLLHMVSGGCWILGFGGCALLYGPSLLTVRPKA
jgi:uncharacterized protein involved in response to NO